MNCDQAFDLMTDPSFTDEAALDAHLQGCERCRQMYETLSPALGLFGKVDSSTAASDEACAVATPVEVARRVALRLGQSNDRPLPSRRRSGLLSTGVVACAAMLLIVFGLAPLMPSSAPTNNALARECTWINRDAAPASWDKPETVVLSCVACHLPSPVE